MAFQTFSLTACPASELQKESLVLQNSSLLLSLAEGLCMSHICLRERHLFGSFNLVLVNLGLSEY